MLIMTLSLRERVVTRPMWMHKCCLLSWSLTFSSIPTFKKLLTFLHQPGSLSASMTQNHEEQCCTQCVFFRHKFTDALTSLHWFRVPECIFFKVDVLTYQAPIAGGLSQFLPPICGTVYLHTSSQHRRWRSSGSVLRLLFSSIPILTQFSETPNLHPTMDLARLAVTVLFRSH